MKFKFFNRPTIKVAMLIFMASLIATSCSANPITQNNNGDSFAKIDTVMRKALGDSIYSIVSEAKKIKVDVIKMEMDSTSLKDGFFVKGKYIPLVKFVLSDPKIYNGYTPVYGSFMPCFSLTFIKKKESCVAKFDFGLKKWAIYNDKGANLKIFDLSSDDMLRLANLLFPNNKHFQSLINVEKK